MVFFVCLFLSRLTGSKKYVWDILKYKAHILKYVPCIFSFLLCAYNKLKIRYRFRVLKSSFSLLIFYWLKCLHSLQSTPTAKKLFCSAFIWCVSPCAALCHACLSYEVPTKKGLPKVSRTPARYCKKQCHLQDLPYGWASRPNWWYNLYCCH